MRSLLWLIDQLYHFPCVLDPISVGFCYVVLPFSPETDDSPRLIWNSSETVKGLDDCLIVGKHIDVRTCLALFCILH